jgi:crotonobetainyl-CoA:carnitine CoA-transferase CaiB-like acyl-CoA transferase
MGQFDKDKLPLTPYRVLDLADDSGVYCTKILAALGADVIRVEAPGGDPTRRIGPFYHDEPDPEKSLHWFNYNLNKRSITLNINCATGQELFKKLVKTADFLVECFPPGYLDKIGLGYKVLHAINPKLVHTSITPFGSNGPYKDLKGTNLVCTAMSGFLYTTGDADRPPVQMATPTAYIENGLHAASATMVAFTYRQRTGKGQHVDVAVRESIMAQFINPGFVWKGEGVIPTRDATGVKLPGKPTNRGVAKCKDGYVIYHTGHFSTRQALREWMASKGMAGDLMDAKWDPIFLKGAPVTIELRQKVDKLFAAFALDFTKQEMMMGAQKRGAQVARESTISDLLDDPHLKEREYFIMVKHPELGTSIPYGGSPFKSDGMSWGYWRRAPFIGENNQDIYCKELDFTPEELAALKEGGVV